MRHVGRPTSYTHARAQLICQRLAGGEPLAHICRDPDMPALRTVHDWRAAHPEFAIDYLTARDAFFETLAAQCLAIANTPVIGLETTTKIDGRVEERRSDMLGHRKLQIDTRLRLLARWDPRRMAEMSGAGAIGDDEDLTPVINVTISRPDPAS
ncbi:MAG: hypothetical protein JWM33_908 [Caulobacteraceae bacterium]|nr:hypothetical protein [Caulobacteraceae bacterium]